MVNSSSIGRVRSGSAIISGESEAGKTRNWSLLNSQLHRGSRGSPKIEPKIDDLAAHSDILEVSDFDVRVVSW